MLEGLPAVAREPEIGFISAFVFFPLSTLNASQFPDAFDKLAEFAMSLSNRFDEESRNAQDASTTSDASNPMFDGLMV